MNVNSILPVSLTASATLNRNSHLGVPITLDAAAGLTVTLPAATGSGDSYSIIVGTTVTSNSYVIQVASSSDIFAGVVAVSTDAAGVSILTAATSDTLTMNGSTTGGLKGSQVTVTDVASGVWAISGGLISTGAEATPFSAAV